MNLENLKTKELEAACKHFQVKELYVFGSVLSDDFSEENRDLYFLVVYDRTGYEGSYDQFMGLKEKLARPVDLLTLGKFRNPLFREEVEKSKTLLYAA